MGRVVKAAGKPFDSDDHLPGETLDRIVGNTRDTAITATRNDGITSSMIAIRAGHRWGADYKLKASVERQARLAGISGVALPMARGHHPVSREGEAWAQRTFGVIARQRGLDR